LPHKKIKQNVKDRPFKGKTDFPFPQLLNNITHPASSASLHKAQDKHKITSLSLPLPSLSPSTPQEMLESKFMTSSSQTLYTVNSQNTFLSTTLVVVVLHVLLIDVNWKA